MKKAIIFLVLLFCVIKTYAFDTPIVSKEVYSVITFYSQQYSKEMYVCKIRLYNPDSTSVITWINREKITETSIYEQIKSHFSRFCGDFNLFSFFYDADTYEVGNCVVLDYLIKEIKPCSNFSYVIVSEKPFIEDQIEDYISIIPKSHIDEFFLSIPIPERMIYQLDEIVIPNISF